MLPIRLRQLAPFIKQLIKRLIVLRSPPRAPCTFHLCYFSCHSYFKYLYCSLHSLIKHSGKVKLQVIIFNDSEQPLSIEQISEINLLIPTAKVILWPKSMGWGAKQITSIWEAYAIAAKNAQDDDIIARVDSDVFFFNDRIFQIAMRSDADLIGDGHYVNLKYSQGGCYFFRASAVHRITNMINNNSIEQALSGIATVVEDMAAYHFARILNLKIWLLWFMMFPDELRNAGGLTPWQRNKFSCIHFVMKNKEEMLKCYQKYIIKDEQSRFLFKKTLETV